MENTETNRNNEKVHLARKKTMKDKKRTKLRLPKKIWIKIQFLYLQVNIVNQ